mgnify:CR=1 FL=1
MEQAFEAIFTARLKVADIQRSIVFHYDRAISADWYALTATVTAGELDKDRLACVDLHDGPRPANLARLARNARLTNYPIYFWTQHTFTVNNRRINIAALYLALPREFQ